MHQQLIEKPIIIAICGKSATGKDTLAKYLVQYFAKFGFFARNIVSVTTRPPRPREKNKIDYYFVSDKQFEDLINNNQLIEFTHFRGWKYGVPFQSIRPGYINIGVFNPEGLKSLQLHKWKYTIVPVYLEEKFSTRMRRSHDREGRWRFEFLRRAIVDYFDFRNLQKKVNLSNGRWIYLQEIDQPRIQAERIKNNMIRWHIFIQDHGILRLGNFV